MPVSRTENQTCLLPYGAGPSSTLTATSPVSVNLMALDTRFVNTCRSRAGSPITLSGNSGPIAQTSSNPKGTPRNVVRWPHARAAPGSVRYPAAMTSSRSPRWGSPDFVAHVGQKLALELGGLLGRRQRAAQLFVCPLHSQGGLRQRELYAPFLGYPRRPCVCRRPRRFRRESGFHGFRPSPRVRRGTGTPWSGGWQARRLPLGLSPSALHPLSSPSAKSRAL